MVFFSKKIKQEKLARKKKATLAKAPSSSTAASSGVTIKLTPVPTSKAPVVQRGFTVLTSGSAASDPSADPSHSNSVTATSSLKRARAIPVDENFKALLSGVVSSSGSSARKAPDVPVSKKAPVVTVPKAVVDQGGAAVRTFKKKTRRELRKGADGSEPEVTFVYEGQEPASSAKKEVKKPKKEFPRLNELIAQVQSEKIKAKEDAKSLKRDAAIASRLALSGPSLDEQKQYVALDCEMVGVGSSGKQSALARVSLTAYDGSVLLDAFVKVGERVTDFRTHVSGVRAKDLKSGQTLSIEEARQRVFDLTDKKILVGHALKNDFKALLMTHPRYLVRDTATYPPYMRAGGRGGGKLKPRKLRDIAKEFLNRSIQVEGQEHNSVDDAKAAMDLYIRARTAWERHITDKAKGKGVGVKKAKKPTEAGVGKIKLQDAGSDDDDDDDLDLDSGDE